MYTFTHKDIADAIEEIAKGLSKGAVKIVLDQN